VDYVDRELATFKAELIPGYFSALGNEVYCSSNGQSLLIRLYDPILTLQGYGVTLRGEVYDSKILIPPTFREGEEARGTYYLDFRGLVFRVSQRNCEARKSEGKVTINCNGEFSLEVLLTGWASSAVARSDESSRAS
jgi:hypothetical protein